jgi:antitoxin ParD1/3/4
MILCEFCITQTMEGHMPTTLERLTITMPPEMASIIRQAVDDGDYASTSEVVREALREWKTKRKLMLDEIASLKADIAEGLADVAAGRVKDFDADSIIARGRRLLAARSN